jgi:hypothetical protein
MSLFTDLLSILRDVARKERIQKALDDSPDFSNAESLREVVAGKTNAEMTSFLQRNLSLGEVDASALAGLLVAPTGNYISISHLIIIPSSFDIDPIYLSFHFSIALSALKSLYISHLISPTRLLLSVK